MVPTCRRCGQQHYNFVPCTNVEEWNSRRPERRPEPPLSLSTPEGFSQWGDRLQSWDRRGNVYYRRTNDGPEKAA